MNVAIGGGKTYQVLLAPALVLSNAELNQVRHHAVLAHGLSVQAIRARSKRGTKVGFADNAEVAVPIADTPENVKAAEAATREFNAPFLTVMLEGRYTDAYLQSAGKDAPKFTDDELKTIGAPLDFVGVNEYRPAQYVEASEEPPGYRIIPISASHPKMKSGWHIYDPEVLYWGPRQLQSIWGAKSIYITENGCAAEDVVAEDGRVYDTDRVMFLRGMLRPAPAGDRRRRAGRWLFLLERAGQPRVERRVREPVRDRLRRLQDAEAHAEAERAVVPSGSDAKRRRVRDATTSDRCVELTRGPPLSD